MNYWYERLMALREVMEDKRNTKATALKHLDSLMGDIASEEGITLRES